MEITTQYLRDTLKVGYEAFEDSIKESTEIWDLYHNRHYTPEQLSILQARGQPAETFNVIKLFARMLVGYYSTVVNTVTVTPRTYQDVTTASVLNDTVNYVFEDNRFDIEGDQIKLGGLVSGLLCSYTNIEDTGERDPFGRPIMRCDTHHVPDYELILDPSSKLDDYSDAQWLHRYRWLSKAKVNRIFGKGTSDKLDAFYNHLNVDEAEFAFNYGEPFSGTYRLFDHYLIVHTVIEDEEGKRWSIFWSGDTILQKKEITFRKARWYYRVQKLHSSNKTEYYGIFRDVKESQKALNQAVLKIQLMVNTEKALVEKNAVEDIEKFTNAFNRVNSVVEVLKLSGVKIETMTREIQEQYLIVDRALDRIQRVLGINDSFLGMAFASDSGRKVKLQQNQTVMSLRYITARIESFYASLGWDIAHLVQQYYTSYQVLSLTDELTGQRFIELNRPMMEYTGNVGPDGQPEMQSILIPMSDPANGEPLVDDDGNFIIAPVSEEGTEIAFTKFTIKVQSSSYNDEDEKAQLMVETVMSGQIGQMISQINPAGFFKMAGLTMRSMKTKYSPEISRVLEETGAMLGQDPAAQQEAKAIASGVRPGQEVQSRGLKLPTNTNEGV